MSNPFQRTERVRWYRGVCIDGEVNGVLWRKKIGVAGVTTRSQLEFLVWNRGKILIKETALRILEKMEGRKKTRTNERI
jgi:hypothetical protein